MSYKHNVTNRNYFNIICQNCGEKGHHVKECINPKTSLGIILYKKNKDKYEYLMICRRNTIGFVEFIRGKYVYSDIDYIKNLFNVMTNSEIRLIKEKSFEYLWEYLWMDNKFNNKNTVKLKKNYDSAYEKFNKIKNGYKIDNTIIDIEYLCKNKTNFYEEQEWGFPKGRRLFNETNFIAAMREFREETQINNDNIRVLSNTKTFNEEYKSYDNVYYKNIYYLAEYIGNDNIGIDEKNKEQYSEVSNIGFYIFENAINNIRDYNSDKKNILNSVNEYLISIS